MYLTFVRSSATRLLLAVACAVPPALAQQTETELLRTIACEIRELRTVVQQGQIVVPLLEANRRERESASAQLANVDKQLREARDQMERWVRNQRSATDGLRALAGASRQELTQEEAAQKRGFEELLRVAELEIPRFQGEEARLFSEAGQIRDRLTRLEDAFDRMQRQMQAIGNTAGSVCEVGSETRK